MVDLDLNPYSAFFLWPFFKHSKLGFLISKMRMQWATVNVLEYSKTQCLLKHWKWTLVWRKRIELVKMREPKCLSIYIIEKRSKIHGAKVRNMLPTFIRNMS